MAKVHTKHQRRVAYLQYLLYRFFETILSVLPVSWVYVIGRQVGKLCYSGFKKRRALVRKNLGIAFPEILEAQGEPAVLEVFANVGSNLLSSVRIGTVPADQISNYYTWVKNEAYDAVVKADHPRMALLGHVSNWELISRAVGQLTENTGALYRKLDNPFLDDLVKRRREKDGMQLFSNRKGLLKAMRLLKDNGWLGLLVDQYVPRTHIDAEVFGQSTKLSRMPEMISNKINLSEEGKGLRVYILCMKSTKPGYWQFEFKLAEQGAQLGKAIETYYEYAPLEVFFFHRLWR